MIHFGVHITPVKTKQGLTGSLAQIVLKDEKGIIIEGGFTGFERYAFPYTGHDLPNGLVSPPGKQKLLFISSALNYLFREEKIRRLMDVDSAMVFRAFDAYREREHREGRRYVSQVTLDKFVMTVSCFFANLAMTHPTMKLQAEELLVQKRLFSKANPNGKGYLAFVPRYHKKALPCCERTTLRDIPEKALDILFDLLKRKDPMIYFAVVLQAYAGLRAGECMNVRRPDSPISPIPGVQVSYLANIPSKMEIDLTCEYRLRGDGVDVGKIKRVTSQLTPVYPKNLALVVAAYNEHLKLLETYPVDSDYRAMFVTSTGKAMTARTYQRRFDAIVKKYLVPALIASEDAELVAFGQALRIHNFPSHGLRHFFSVGLALDGLDAAQIMAYRGDRAVDSSLVYLKNKGALDAHRRKAHAILLAGLKK